MTCSGPHQILIEVFIESLVISFALPETWEVWVCSPLRGREPLCVKWIIRALSGDEAWKILLRHCIQSSFLLHRPTWKGIGLQTLLVKWEPVHIVGTFVAKSIWKAWEMVKSWFYWSRARF